MSEVTHADRLIRFQKPDHEPVYVNPAMVSSVEGTSSHSGKTLIRLADPQSPHIVVMGTAGEVATVINQAMTDARPPDPPKTHELSKRTARALRDAAASQREQSRELERQNAELERIARQIEELAQRNRAKKNQTLPPTP